MSFGTRCSRQASDDVPRAGDGGGFVRLPTAAHRPHRGDDRGRVGERASHRLRIAQVASVTSTCGDGEFRAAATDARRADERSLVNESVHHGRPRCPFAPVTTTAERSLGGTG